MDTSKEGGGGGRLEVVLVGGDVGRRKGSAYGRVCGGRRRDRSSRAHRPREKGGLVWRRGLEGSDLGGRTTTQSRKCGRRSPREASAG